MLDRRDEFRGAEIMQERAERNPKIEIIWNREVVEMRGEMTVGSLTLRDTRPARSRSSRSRACSSPSARPNTDLFAGQLRVGEGGYLRSSTRPGRGSRVSSWPATSRTTYRQAVTAAGDGCKAAIDAERWLASVGEIEASTATNW